MSTPTWKIWLGEDRGVDVDSDELMKLAERGLIEIKIEPKVDRSAILHFLGERPWEKPKRTARQATPKPSKQQVAHAKDRETRDRAILRYVEAKPGITVREISEQMGLKDATSLYRVVKRLTGTDQLVKQGQKLFLPSNDQQ